MKLLSGSVMSKNKLSNSISSKANQQWNCRQTWNGTSTCSCYSWTFENCKSHLTQINWRYLVHDIKLLLSRDDSLNFLSEVWESDLVKIVISDPVIRRISAQCLLLNMSLVINVVSNEFSRIKQNAYMMMTSTIIV